VCSRGGGVPVAGLMTMQRQRLSAVLWEGGQAECLRKSGLGAHDCQCLLPSGSGSLECGRAAEELVVPVCGQADAVELESELISVGFGLKLAAFDRRSGVIGKEL
jgi:hypothetical protein